MSREAMQMALEALESDPVSHAGLVNRKQAITALRQALVDEMVKTEHDKQIEIAQAYERGWNAALAQREWVPKALRLADALEELDAQFSHTGLCGEAAAELRRLALKQWVGLTDEDYKELSKIAFVEVIEKIERVLKEKNT